MLTQRLSAVAAAVAVAAVAAACSSGSTSGTPPSAPSRPPTVIEAPGSSPTLTPPSSADTPPSPAAVESSASPSEEPSGIAGHGHAAEVTIEDFAFAPASLKVQPGQTVAWSNKDGEPHTVRSEDGSISSAIISGKPFEWTAEGAPGTEISYICSIHPSMKGAITISG